MRKLVYKKILYFLLLAASLLQYGCKEDYNDFFNNDLYLF